MRLRPDDVVALIAAAAFACFATIAMWPVTKRPRQK
jgi:hypothetical protein